MAKAVTGGKKAEQGLKCGECGMEMDGAVWRRSDTIYHCEGGTGFGCKYHGEVHHSPLMLHPLCWKCGKVVGCRLCCGIRREALCGACAAWVTVGAFVEHGAISNIPALVRRRYGLVAPVFEDYPPEFRRAYLEQNGEPTVATEHVFRELLARLGSLR